MNDETLEVYKDVFKEQIEKAKYNPDTPDVNKTTMFGTHPKPGEQLLMFLADEVEENDEGFETHNLKPTYFNYPSELEAVFFRYDFKFKHSGIPTLVPRKNK